MKSIVNRPSLDAAPQRSRPGLALVLPVLVVLVALSLAACGGDDGDNDGAGDSASSSTPQGESTDAGTTTTSSEEAAATVDGDWSGTYESSQGGTGTFEMKLTQSGEEFSGPIEVPGTCIPTGTMSGTVSGSEISFGAVKGDLTISYDGTLKGDTMSGTYSAPADCGSDSGTWEASRSG